MMKGHKYTRNPQNNTTGILQNNIGTDLVVYDVLNRCTSAS